MLTSPYQKLSKRTEKGWTIFAVVFFLVTAGLMIYLDTPLKTNVSPNGIVSFELAKKLECSTTILNTWKAKEGAMISAKQSLWLDYVFMFAYAFLLSLIIHKVNRVIWKGNETLYNLGVVLIRAVFFAAFLDAIENVALLKLFYGDMQQHWSTLAFVTALNKFIILIIAILFVLISIPFGFKKLKNAKK